MVTWLIILWMAMQLEAPTWIYVVIGTMIALQLVDWLLGIINKVSEKRLEKELERLEDLKEKYGK